MIPPKSEASNSLETPAPCQSAKDLNATPTAGKEVILVDAGPLFCQKTEMLFVTELSAGGEHSLTPIIQTGPRTTMPFRSTITDALVPSGP